MFHFRLLFMYWLTASNKQTRHIDNMSANYGGTEMRGALQKVFSMRNNDIPTSVFVLTDGEVSIYLVYSR